jgi:CRP/FNR family transcriptional regulator, anaerobic regulatory protein
MMISLAQDSRGEHVPGWLVDAPIRVVRDQNLFRRGQPKTHIYLIEAGTLAVYETRIDGTRNVVEFAFAGDTVGFGFLENHLYSAQAVGEARVRCLPLTALDQILQHDKRAMQRYAEAMQREFEFRRDELISADRKSATRVAALFLTLSRRNEEEGRDPRMIGDSLDCGTVAGYLELDLDTLGGALAELEHAKLIERCPPRGLRLTDLAGLEQLANEVTQ